jgi:hypothetical protein
MRNSGFRSALAILLACGLAWPAEEQSALLKEQVLSTSSRSTVEIRLRGKSQPSKPRGRIQEVDDSGFELFTNGETRHITFADLRSLKVVDRMRPDSPSAAMLPGDVVEAVSTAGSKPKTIRGRIADVNERGMDLLVLQRDKIATLHLAAGDYHSVQRVSSVHRTSTGAKIGQGIGIGLGITVAACGVLFVVGLIMWKTGA